MDGLVTFQFNIHDVMFIRKAIQERAVSLCDYITEQTDSFVESHEEEKEINDVEIDDFLNDLKEMVEKQTPKKVGRPKGSKNVK